MRISNYSPRPLSVSREYPGYQFYAILRLKGRIASDCLRYVALTVQNWLCQRLQGDGNDVPEALRCPAAADYMSVASTALKSCRLKFTEIISLPEEGIWTLAMREPHPEIAARAFATHVGVRTLGDEEVEFGVRVDIVDRDPNLPEQDKAFRPQFVRLLFETQGMTLRQVEPLAFRKYVDLADRKAARRLKALADDPGNQLPLVVFTRAKVQAPPVDMESVMASMKALPPLPRLEGFRPPEPIAPQREQYALPYDAREFASHVYGFAQAYVASEGAFDELRAKFNRAGLKEGDILILEPKGFGGGVRTIPYKAGLKDSWYIGVTDELQASLQCYSKHKPFNYGGVPFVEEARQLRRDRELEAIRTSVHAERESGEVRKLLEQLELEHNSNDELTRQNAKLHAQLQTEYQRGEENEKRRADALENQLQKAKADCAELKNQIESMQQAFAELTALRGVARSVQKIKAMPKTTGDVAAFYRMVFADRIDFTEQGLRTAAKCDINPDVLWECLFWAATELVDLHRRGVQDVEKQFKQRTNWDVAMTEGSQTRKIQSFMNLRRDTYDGREISIEPHIKFHNSALRSGAKFQRLYYAYDAQTRKIIVGYVGEHLDNFTGLSFS